MKSATCSSEARVAMRFRSHGPCSSTRNQRCVEISGRIAFVCFFLEKEIFKILNHSIHNSIHHFPPILVLLGIIVLIFPFPFLSLSHSHSHSHSHPHSHSPSHPSYSCCLLMSSSVVVCRSSMLRCASPSAAACGATTADTSTSSKVALPTIGLSGVSGCLDWI